MAFKKWHIAAYDKELAKQLADECDIDALTALIAVSRGYTDAFEIEEFLSDEINVSSPYELADMEKAAKVINGAVENKEKLAIFGDYDCDGVTATALLYRYLKTRNADVIYKLPDRFKDGYGISLSAIDYFAENGVTTIITVDNGISAVNEIAYANKKGIKTVVTDHHLPPEVLPEAAAIIDPHRKDCPSQYKEISGVGVAFKLVCALEDKPVEEMLYYYGDLVAIGTVGDVMPLNYDNRSFVKTGIKVLKENPNTGIGELMAAASVNTETLNATSIAFGIVPRLNAAGRMEKADLALELLITDDQSEAKALAEKINTLNARRQETGNEIFKEAEKIIREKKYYNNRVIVVDGENWHKGIIGIVAGKLTEKYAKPCIVISSENGEATGSGRSTEGFSLYNCISSAKDILTKFGGHDLAAGFSLNASDTEKFRKTVNEYAKQFPVTVPQINIDCKLNPAALCKELAEELTVLEPFGNGNPLPTFAICNLTLMKITPIGSGKHLRLGFCRDEVTFNGLLFGVTEEIFPFAIGDTVDIAVNAELNTYNGKTDISVKIVNIRVSGIDDEKVVKEIDLYNRFVNGEDVKGIISRPTREEFGTVYKYIAPSEKQVSAVQNKFINSLGYAKYNIIKDVFSELGLVKTVNGKLTAVAGVRAELSNSEILKRLGGE